MSLNKDSQEKLFTATNELQDFLPEDDPMMVFERTIYPAFNDEDFAQCYSTKGRHAIPPAYLACVTLLQFRENLSDPETSEACVRRIDWKIALHRPLKENVSFDSSTLCNYRKRLKENDKMSLTGNTRVRKMRKCCLKACLRQFLLFFLLISLLETRCLQQENKC